VTSRDHQDTNGNDASLKDQNLTDTANKETGSSSKETSNSEKQNSSPENKDKDSVDGEPQVQISIVENSRSHEDSSKDGTHSEQGCCLQTVIDLSKKQPQPGEGGGSKRNNVEIIDLTGADSEWQSSVQRMSQLSARRRRHMARAHFAPRYLSSAYATRLV